MLLWRAGTAVAALLASATAFTATPSLRSPGLSSVLAACPGGSRGSRVVAGVSTSTSWQRAPACALRMSGMMNSRDGEGDESEGKGDDARDGLTPSSPFYRSDNGTRDAEFSGLAVSTPDTTNPYVKMLESLTPGEMVGQFMSTAPPRVQAAVKNTVIGLLGSLRASAAFDASVATTQRALASLMFQLEMTGYMFRNAEYRLALQKSLLDATKDAPALPEASDSNTRPALKGSITVTLPDGTEVEVPQIPPTPAVERMPVV